MASLCEEYDKRLFTEQNKHMKDTHSVAMGKESVFQRTCQEYSEWSLVHGVAYVFATSLPRVDRVAWGLLVLAGLGLASYWSIASYNTWQEELTITTLKDAAMPINKIPFPAVTICSSGLDMEAVKKALMIDFDTWMMEEGRVSVDKVEDKDIPQQAAGESHGGGGE